MRGGRLKIVHVVMIWRLPDILNYGFRTKTLPNGFTGCFTRSDALLLWPVAGPFLKRCFKWKHWRNATKARPSSVCSADTFSLMEKEAD